MSSLFLYENQRSDKYYSDQVLPFAIQKLKAKGYTFKTVADCLGLPAYASVGTPGTKDVSA